jgi:2-keto-4-pentenoate hydratase/2-oxohepta-3-ene-1,7-dioic acid hydratase in catechol pathway
VPDAEQVERVAAIIGADGAIGGFTPLVEWIAPGLQGAKQRDFALTLGPIVTTPDEGVPGGVDWEGLVAHAAENTTLYPGDLIVR